MLGSCGALNVNAKINDAAYEQPNNDTPVAVLDTIVVTATRSEKYLNDTPVKVQVLDSVTLQKNQAHTLKQALDLLPNVHLVQLHGKNGYEVRMQGFTGDQVLVLIDGLPISASTGSAVNLNQYLNTNVQQIEVIEGAASAQYGSSAMGGVINVITKPINDSSASITAELATNGKQNPSGKSFDNNVSFVEANVEGAVTADGRLKARLSGSYLDDEGISVDTDKWPQLKDSSAQKQLNAKLTYTPNLLNGRPDPSTSLWLEAGLYNEDVHGRFSRYIPRQNIVQNMLRDEEIDRNRYVIGGQTQIPSTLGGSQGAYKLSGSFLYEDYDSDSKSKAKDSNKVTIDRKANIGTKLAQIQLDLPTLHTANTHSHDLQFGLKWQKDDLSQEQNNVSELSEKTVDRKVAEAYIQDDWFIGNNSEIVAGIRYQNDSDFGNHISPKIAYKHNYYDSNNRKHVFRASVGQGYRVPNLKERYYVFDHSNYGYMVFGNPDLTPEKSKSYQLGYETNLNDKVNLSINGFYNDVKDLIQTDSDNPVIKGKVASYYYKNINNAKTYGGNLNIDWAITAKNNLNLGYSYLHTENKATGSELTNSPQHRVVANWDYQMTDKIKLLQQLTYESKTLIGTRNQTYSPSWLVFNTRANYAATPNLDLYMAINNLFDKQRDVADSNDQGPVDNRQYLIGAKYTW